MALMLVSAVVTGPALETTSPTRFGHDDPAVAVYADVCDDAGDEPLDVRTTDIEARSGVLRFRVSTCADWAEAALEGGSLRWDMSAPDGAAHAVTIARSDGAATVVVTRRLDDGTEVTTYTGSTARYASSRMIGAEVPSSSVGSPDRFDVVLALRRGADEVDELPETAHGEPPVSYPATCEASTAVLRTAAGGHRAASAAARSAGLSIVADLAPIGALAVELPAADSAVSLRELPHVVSVRSPASVRRMQVTPDDPSYVDQWSLPAVGADRAWWTISSSSLPVAVIDDGVDAARPDLRGRVLAGRDTRFGTELAAGRSSDRGGHGTAVSGVLTAGGDDGVGLAGVDWGATILPYRVFDAAGCGDASHVAAAIIAAADAGAVAINLSLGAFEDDPLYRDAIDYARDRGVVLVAAVGNTADSREVYPAAYSGVIGVGATLRDGTVATYSNDGPWVDVVAPGGDGRGSASGDLLVLGERGTVVPAAGTSYATPIVTGSVLLYRALNPDAPPAVVADAIARAARDLGPAGYDEASGHGLLDLHRLVVVAGTDRACPSGEVPSAGFDDVSADNVHRPAIDCLTWRGLLRGTGDRTYAPGVTVTRGQVATVVARVLEAAGATLPSGHDHFTDDDGHPHEGSIDQLAEAGILRGSDGRFRPDDALTRGQIAAVLVRAYEHVSRTVPDTTSPFIDLGASVHRHDIERAHLVGLVRGDGDGRYRPAAAVRRDQIASFALNLVGAFAREGRVEPTG